MLGLSADLSAQHAGIKVGYLPDGTPLNKVGQKHVRSWRLNVAKVEDNSLPRDLTWGESIGGPYVSLLVAVCTG